MALLYKEQNCFREANVHFKATKELLDQIGHDKLSLESQINFHLQMALNARAIGDPFGSMKSLKKALLLLDQNAFNKVSYELVILTIQYKDLYASVHYWIGVSESSEKEAAQHLLNYLTTLLDCERFTYHQCDQASHALYHVSLYLNTVGNSKFSKELLFDASELAKLISNKELSAKIEQALASIGEKSSAEGIKRFVARVTQKIYLLNYPLGKIQA